MGEPYPDEAPRRGGGLKWTVAAGALCAASWIGLYFASLQPLQEELADLRAARALLEQEVPTLRAERELAWTEKELAALLGRWDTTTVAGLARGLEAHSVTLRKAQPGEEIGAFILDVEGSAHGLGQALPAWEKPSAPGRLPAVLYFRKVKQDQALRARFRLEGTGRVTDLQPVTFDLREMWR